MTGTPCQFSCASKNVIEKHISSSHQHDKIRRACSAKQLYTQGHVQRFFPNREGSSYFRVTPILAGVAPGSDFDIWYHSLPDEDRRSRIPTAVMVGDSDDRGVADLSPFLAKAGWVGQLEGFSCCSLWK